MKFSSLMIFLYIITFQFAPVLASPIKILERDYPIQYLDAEVLANRIANCAPGLLDIKVDPPKNTMRVKASERVLGIFQRFIENIDIIPLLSDAEFNQSCKDLARL